MEMISLGMWVAGLFGKSPGAAAARKIGMAVVVIVAVLLLVVLAVIGVRMHKAGIVEQYQDKRDAQVAQAVVNADRAADEAQANRLAEVEAENDRLENAMAEAKRKDPKSGQSEVGPVQQSYFDNLPKKGK